MGCKFLILSVLFLFGIILISCIGFVSALIHITDCNGLNNIRNNLGESYVLDNDINCNVAPYNTGAGFEPIGGFYINTGTPIGGFSSDPFSGSLDGKCHKITGLYMNRGDIRFCTALFCSQSGTISNLGLENVFIQGQGAASLATKNSGTINGCYVKGSVIGINGCGAGGLVKENWGTVSNSYSWASVFSTKAGSGPTGTCAPQYSDWSGGLVFLNVVSITNSYAIGIVSSADYDRSGGLTTTKWNNNNPDSAFGTTIGSFWDIDTSGVSYSLTGTGLHTSAMKTKSTFIGAGWTSPPWILADGDYPKISCCSPQCDGKQCGNDGCGGFCGSLGGGCPASNPICGPTTGKCGCNSASDCGTDVIFGDTFCQPGNIIFRNKIVHSCSVSGTCSNSVIKLQVQACSGICISCSGNNCPCVGRKKTFGLYDPSTSTFFLKNSPCPASGSCYADITFGYGLGGSQRPIAGDWDEDGKTTIGLYDPATSTFYLKNSNTAGNADITFSYEPGGNKIPIAGDWDGDGKDSIGLFDPKTNTFYLKNSNTAGNADITPFLYGTANEGWLPIAGDWDGDGKDSIGLYNPATSTFYLKNSNIQGYADITFVYGAGGSQIPIAGDWDGDGKTTIGLYDPSTSTFFLRNSNTQGYADITFGYGFGGSQIPIAGDWDEDGDVTCSNANCGESFSVNSVNWADMRDTPITNADLNDRVKLIVRGVGFNGKNFNFTIIKKGTGLFSSDILVYGPIEVIGSDDSIVSTTWRANVTGDYYYNVTTFDGKQNSSGILQVSNIELNSAPVANITNPKKGEVYFKGVNVSFNQSSYDIDDFMNYSWYLDELNIIVKGSTRDYINYNLNYSYSSAGQKNINLSVIDERGLTDNDLVSILIIDTSPSGNGKKYVFAGISKPKYKEIITMADNVEFNANDSYAIDVTTIPSLSIKCLGGKCPDSILGVSPSNYDRSKNNDFSVFNFSWRFDDGVESGKISGNPKYSRGFSPGDYFARLEVSLNSGEKSNASVIFKYLGGGSEKCQVGKTLWVENGVGYNTLDANGKCRGENIIDGSDDCCPPSYTCQGSGSTAQCKVLASCLSISNCGNYIDETNCTNDQCKVGLKNCGGTTQGDICVGVSSSGGTIGGACNCFWDGSAAEGMKCRQKKPASINIAGISIKSNCIIDSIVQGECTDGQMIVTQHSTISWDYLPDFQTYLDTIGAIPSDPDEWLNDNCHLSSCFSGTRPVICDDNGIRLGFFNWINALIAIIIIVIVYLVLNSFKKSKKARKKR